MKKLHVSAISILFAVLCLVFTACNQGIIAGNETGTVQVVIGGGGRAVDAAGMPVFDDTNTKITVTDENGNKLAEGTTSVTVNADIGTKITVKAVVTTAAGTWRGSVEHTVTAGTNIVAVKLSKTPKNMGNILSSVISQSSFGDAKVTFKLASGKELLNDVDIGSNHIIPVIARDGIGRIYVLYDDKSGRHFTRFNAEGNVDTGFETAINAVLPSTTGIEAITVDAKTNRIFVVDGAKHVYAVTETSHNTFTRSNGFNLASFIGSGNTIQTAAAYNGTLFFTVPPSATSVAGMKNKLVAVKAELSGSSLTLTKKDEKTLPKLRTASAFGNYLTNCTGLFADENNVYCLLTQHKYDAGKVFALGQLVRYTYSGSTLTEETKIGLHSKAGASDSSLAFEAGAFVNPIGFIGYDEENIYIADDGYNIEYLNENWRTNGNKNRIAAFNRKTNEITFTDTAATWYEQKPEYKYPNTKILLWEKDSGGNFRYWTSAAGTDPFSSDNKLFEASASEKPTDIFCYDQEGNLYILWKDGSNNHKVRRFALKADSTYDTAGADSSAIGATPRTPKYIAVDVSDGQNCLYYGSEDGDWRVSKATWSGAFSPSSISSATEVITSITGKMTALAANKDGVFVATKQTGLTNRYTLKVTKYKKDSPDTSDVTIVSSAIAEDSYSSPDPYNEYNEAIYDLRIVDGVLYAVTSKLEKRMVYRTVDYGTDEFKSSGLLYKIAEAASFSGNAMVLHTKYPVLPQGTSKQGVGYGFYRFIAVKPKKLVIASGGACAIGGNALAPFGTQPDRASDNKVMIYDLDGNLQEPEEKNAGGTFSQKLSVDASGFKWE